MELTLSFVGGLTLIGVTFDFLGKKLGMVSSDTVQRLVQLGQQVKFLKPQAFARGEQIARPEDKTASRRQP
jgi:hypothetical protein